MQIETGLFDHMVIQRDQRDRSNQSITGTCEASGIVRASVKLKGKPVRGVNGATIGKARDAKFSATLKGLPVGGPYEIELSVGDERLRVRDVLVGDVWIAGGQSNMQGCGRRADRCKPHKQVRAFYMNDTWDVACDPIHNMWDCVDQVHIDLAGGVRPGIETNNGVGPAVPFAQEMHRLTGNRVPQGILACAHGGTSMAQWDVSLKHLGTKSLYGATVRRLKKNGGRCAGMIWYQGESDAIGEDQPWKRYTERTKALIQELRRDASDPELPVAIVQISRVVTLPLWPGWNSVQDQQRLLPKLIKNVVTVPAIDLELSDGIHIGGPDQQRLGRRLARAMQTLMPGSKRTAHRPPISVRGVKVEKDPVNGCANVVVRFDNVIGRLTSSGVRPVGFSVANVNDPNNEAVYSVSLDTDTVVCKTSLPMEQLSTEHLFYGRGINPVCNITDAADQSLPVFGPLRLGKPRALTPFVLVMEVSAMQPGAGKLETLTYPQNSESLGFARREFVGEFADLHADILTHGTQDAVVYYRCILNLTEPMQLRAMLGSDGPVKMWIDGEEKAHDPTGINPAPRDKTKIDLSLGAGKHEVLVALGTNHGKAWGIFLRFERMDLTKQQMKQEPAQYPMPTVG